MHAGRSVNSLLDPLEFPFKRKKQVNHGKYVWLRLIHDSLNLAATAHSSLADQTVRRLRLD